jgi:hypothetical protein
MPAYHHGRAQAPVKAFKASTKAWLAAGLMGSWLYARLCADCRCMHDVHTSASRAAASTSAATSLLVSGARSSSGSSHTPRAPPLNSLSITMCSARLPSNCRGHAGQALQHTAAGKAPFATVEPRGTTRYEVGCCSGQCRHDTLLRTHRCTKYQCMKERCSNANARQLAILHCCEQGRYGTLVKRAVLPHAHLLAAHGDLSRP